MKKIFTAILCFMLLVSMLAVSVFAEGEPNDEVEADIEFSIGDATGKPGEIITVDVFLDKNIGTWACCFDMHFNERYFTLLSVDNGDVYTDGEFVKSKLTNRGKYRYYAEGNDPDINNYNTGLILTLTFEVNEETPSGVYDFKMNIPDDGKGWFFDGSEFPDYPTVYTVACTKTGVVEIITDNQYDNTEVPDTDSGDDTNLNEDTNSLPESNDQQNDNSDRGDLPGIPVYDYVEDEEGNLVTDADGEYVKTPAKDDNGNLLYYETDKYNEVVTDENGDNVTIVDTAEKVPGSETAEDTTTGTDDGSEGGFSPYKIILIAAVAAVVIGAIIVIIVLTRPKKEKE